MTQPGDDELASHITNVVNATVGVGTTAVRAIARMAVPGPDAPAPQVGDLVRYGVGAAESVLGLVLDGVRTAAGVPLPTRGTSGGAASPGRTDLPRIHAGSVLRLPLLVENRGDLPMADIRFACTRTEPAGALGADDIAFDPPVLTVAPRDFEKVTVRVRTGADTPPARYRIELAGGDGAFHTTVAFDVVPVEEVRPV